jgi:translation initiation factor IF-3
MRISPRIDNHDYQIKLNHIREFLEKKHKVKIRMMFRGREIAHRDIGDRLIGKLLQDVEKVGKIDKQAIMLGRTMVLILGPK